MDLYIIYLYIIYLYIIYIYIIYLYMFALSIYLYIVFVQIIYHIHVYIYIYAWNVMYMYMYIYIAYTDPSNAGCSRLTQVAPTLRAPANVNVYLLSCVQPILSAHVAVCPAAFIPTRTCFIIAAAVP